MPSRLSHDPRVLYHASLERIAEARRAFLAADYVVSMYLAGVAVECVVQSVVLLDYPSHDARHDLNKWLARGRTSLQDAVKASDTRAAWSFLTAVWRNGLRYLSEAGLLGYLRDLDLQRGIGGGTEAIIKVNARRLVTAAELVHAKGTAAWKAYTKG